jgi:protein-S-isoprenylcysteine O-methyltransferase Ste14
MALSLFVAAWTLDFWQGWLYLAVFFTPVLMITVYFLRADPGLIESRLKPGPTAETRIRQKIIQSLASIFFILMFIVPGFDHRLQWSQIPVVLTLAAAGGVLFCFLIIFLVFRENSYSSAVVEIANGQKVISTGPYAIVRHPMYSAALLLFFFTPIALGSWWALPLALPMCILIALRLLDEEKLLFQSLEGYPEYCRLVPFRLVPFIW